MQTQLPPGAADSADATTAAGLIRRCVHCGFCNATCPTYQLLGDERDGPRGRIYLIKQMLEGNAPTERTQLHLDRCLTCRACETTCPSGVRYGRLVDIGREVVEKRTWRGPWDWFKRSVLSFGLTRASLFGFALKLGRAFRPFLTAGLKQKVPQANTGRTAWPAPRHARRMLVLGGCVQPVLAPSINAAAVSSGLFQ